MEFQDLPLQTKREKAFKVMYLMAHLECVIDMIEELSFQPDINKFSFKRAAKNCSSESATVLKNIMYDPGIDSSEMNLAQLQHFDIIKRIKDNDKSLESIILKELLHEAEHSEE